MSANEHAETARGLSDEALALREYTALRRERGIPYTWNYGFEGRKQAGMTQTRV